MKDLPFIFFLPLWVFLSSTSAHPADFQAKVIHIADGDTITVLNDTNEQVKIRLNSTESTVSLYGVEVMDHVK